MESNNAESGKLLIQALTRAELLVADLKNQFAEVQVNPPNLPQDQLEQGRFAMHAALDSAQRLLRELDDAKKTSAIDTN